MTDFYKGNIDGLGSNAGPKRTRMLSVPQHSLSASHAHATACNAPAARGAGIAAS